MSTPNKLQNATTPANLAEKIGHMEEGMEILSQGIQQPCKEVSVHSQTTQGSIPKEILPTLQSGYEI